MTIVSGNTESTSDIATEYTIISVKSVGPDIHKIKILVSVSIVISMRYFGNVTRRGHPQRRCKFGECTIHVVSEVLVGRGPVGHTKIEIAVPVVIRPITTVTVLGVPTPQCVRW